MDKKIEFTMTKKTNYWKAATILLGILVISLIVYGEYQKKQEQENLFDLGPLGKIPKEDMQSFLEVFKGEQFQLCNIELNECYFLKPRR